ncbi:MAG TPA: NHL repeat-containing protein [Blastocatellia bacterium]
MRKAAIAVAALAVLGLVILYLLRRGPAYLPTQRNLIGKVATLAGTGAPGFADGRGTEATFGGPFGIAVDDSDNLFIADGGPGSGIRKLDAKGALSTLAGTSHHSDDTVSPTLDTPSAIAIDKHGNLIVADTGGNRITKISRDGKVTPIAGSGRGYRDGPADQAQFDSPVGVAVDGSGNIYVADTYNDRIRKISTDGQVTTVAGSGTPGSDDGVGAAASFDTPCGIVVDPAGNLFVADTGNDAIRKIAPDSVVTVFTGGNHGRHDGKGTDAAFENPCGIVLTHDGFFFVTDESSGLIREVSPEGDVSTVAGGGSGFRDETGDRARFNAPSGIAVDHEGNLYIADRDNYLIRKITPALPGANQGKETTEEIVQPSAPGTSRESHPAIPILTPRVLGIKDSFPWPLKPQDAWHEVAGVVGEARGAVGGIALDHLHSGLDIKGTMGDKALSVYDEKVSSPIPNWGFGETGEGLHVGVVSYIHVRIGRDSNQNILDPEIFKPRLDKAGKLVAVRVRRGTRFKVGDAIGTLNTMNHVHLNLGPWNAQANPIQFPFVGFKDTVAPVIESNGIDLVDRQGRPFTQKRAGRLVISGDVSIIVAAYDRVDGNAPVRKLGLYRAGYQILREDGSPAPGFEQPLINIDFGRLPADPEAVLIAYAPGSGVSAYGTPTKFRYIVTNVVKDGEAARGVFRADLLPPGNYILRVLAMDYAGNVASGKDTLVPITIDSRQE